MAKTARQLAAMGAMVVLGGTASAAASDPQGTLVLSVNNQCRVPEPILEAAQEIATSVYAAIGVRLVWVAAGTQVPVGVEHTVQLRVSLTGEAHEASLLSALASVPESKLPNVLAFAPTAARSAYLLCRRIDAIAKKSKINRLDVAFGRVLAHEIGHLMLPGKGHSDAGIMRASLDLNSIDTPSFTEGQGESIRGLLAAAN